MLFSEKRVFVDFVRHNNMVLPDISEMSLHCVTLRLGSVLWPWELTAECMCNLLWVA